MKTEGCGGKAESAVRVFTACGFLKVDCCRGRFSVFAVFCLPWGPNSLRRSNTSFALCSVFLCEMDGVLILATKNRKEGNGWVFICFTCFTSLEIPKYVFSSSQACLGIYSIPVSGEQNCLEWKEICKWWRDAGACGTCAYRGDVLLIGKCVGFV